MNHLFIENSIRLVVAMLLGGLIGIEREYRAKNAGFRTHFLVAIGAALFTIISQYGFGDGVKDASRVAAQIVSGIGFLGAGLIVIQKNNVRGLTTAAGLWVTAAIGMACGVGMYAIAALVTLLILIALELLHNVIPQNGHTALQISFSTHSREAVNRVVEQIRNDGADISAYQMRNRHIANHEFYEVKLSVKAPNAELRRNIVDYVSEFDDVQMVNIE